MTRQFKKNQLKQVETQSQSGRSMIEMLGVLAIIAILSIGGIVGYKLAMNYYQADQIANEINLMRNDLKVKYALGNEELLLGDPYDDTPENKDYSGHLSTQYDRYPVDYDCIIRGNKESKNELYNCREADAYYIVVGNVSKGVCKPLTTLVAAMDGRLEMDINGISYTEGDSCTSDEANEIYVEFDAADVNGNYDSNRPEGWCAKDDDCEGLSTPVCDKENNECVECMKNADCASNVCRGDYTCGECTKDSDCVNPRPICDTEAATCVGCADDTECPDANKPSCDTVSGACCDDPFMTWNGSECVCPEDQPWNGEFCGCKSNNDCESGEFCLTSECQPYECGDSGEVDQAPYYIGTITEERSCAGVIHRCVKKSEYTAQNHDSNSSYILSSQGMNWWSAQRFCEAHNKQMVKISDLDCCHSFSKKLVGYCYAKQDICSATNGLSHVVKSIRKAENGKEDQGNNWYWLADPWGTDPGPNSCAVYMLNLDVGGISNNNRSNGHIDGGQRYALCK